MSELPMPTPAESLHPEDYTKEQLQAMQEVAAMAHAMGEAADNAVEAGVPPEDVAAKANESTDTPVIEVVPGDIRYRAVRVGSRLRTVRVTHLDAVRRMLREKGITPVVDLPPKEREQ